MLYVLLQNVKVQYAQGSAETPRKAMMDWACGYNGIRYARTHTHTHTQFGVTTPGKSS